MAKPRISCFIHDLAANPIIRAVPLARALEPYFDIEFVGFLISGDSVYAPCRDIFPTKTIRCSMRMTEIAANLSRLARMAEGELIYAFKPLVTSLGPALLASGFGRRKPLIVDAEDDEWTPFGDSLAGYIWRDVVRGWRDAIALKYTLSLHPFTSCAAAITVSSRKLQQRYGGTIVRHGPDEAMFDPARSEFSDVKQLRRRYGLPLDQPIALFAGMPQPHKDLDVLAEALLYPETNNWHLALAGPPDHPTFARVAHLLPGRVRYLGFVPQSEMPALLAAVDALPVPQRRVRFTESQIPAKLLEGMAMKKAVIASRVGDLPDILGENQRGWLYDPDNAGDLAACFAAIASDSGAAHARGEASRGWFVQECSRDATMRKLLPLVNALLARTSPAVLPRIKPADPR